MSLVRRPIRQYWLYRLLHTKSIQLTRTIARRYGQSFGFVYVGGYPRSGTTWISRLIGHYLDLPVPRDSALPLAFECVVHHHWRHEPAWDRSIYVIRDGRDVMASEFVRMMSGMQAMRDRVTRFGKLSPVEKALLLRFGRDARLARRLERMLGVGADPWNVERNLPIFIEANMQQPLSEVVADPWPSHVTQWLQRREHTVIVSYEEMTRDGASTLTRVLAELLQKEPDAEKIDLALRRCSFQATTGRPQGVEDPAAATRKGVVGDWKRYFSREASEVFDRYAGRTLIDLGYEPDRSWIGAT